MDAHPTRATDLRRARDVRAAASSPCQPLRATFHDEPTVPLGRPRPDTIAATAAAALELGAPRGVRRLGVDLVFLYRDLRGLTAWVRVDPLGRLVQARVDGLTVPGAALREAVRRRLGPLDTAAVWALVRAEVRLRALPFQRGAVALP